MAILWQAERPLAVAAGGVLMLASGVSGPLREPLVAAARRAGLKVIQRREAELWSLMPASGGPPSPRAS